MAEAGDEIIEALETRFGERIAPAATGASATEATLATHTSHRAFAPRPVPDDAVRYLCALALSSPSKSDLQQRDIVIVKDAAKRAAIAALIPDQTWIAAAPALLVFCGNNRRQRQLHAWRGHPFVNDHLDAFFNATVDAAIALSTFITAAASLGLGCCPISAVRNEARAVSDLLALPDHVFPVAGLGLGYPQFGSRITPRLPLDVTVHTDTFDERDLEARISAYDRRRAALLPYAQQRNPARFGTAADYGWSEEKARHYASPERAGFGAFVRAKGFNLT
jgi:nitroreductase/FMN reductase [NAD(P)H]